MLKPDLGKPYQAVCSKSITSYLFSDELPEHMKEVVKQLVKSTESLEE